MVISEVENLKSFLLKSMLFDKLSSRKKQSGYIYSCHDEARLDKLFIICQESLLNVAKEDFLWNML